MKNYLINLSSKRANWNAILEQKYSNQRPLVENLCIVRRVAYLYILKKEYLKLQSKITCCFFLSYNNKNKL